MPVCGDPAGLGVRSGVVHDLRGRQADRGPQPPALTDWLTGLSGSTAIVLGIILGLMMGFDLGGPINKVAYTFATAGLTTAIAVESTGQAIPALQIMAAVMGGRHDPTVGHGCRHSGPPEAVSPRRSGRTGWPAGCSVPPSSPKVRFRSPPPTRCGSSRRAWSGPRSTGGLVMLFGKRTARPRMVGSSSSPLVSKPVLYLLGHRDRHADHRGTGHRADEPGTPRRPKNSPHHEDVCRGPLPPDRAIHSVSTCTPPAGDCDDVLSQVPAVCRNSPTR